MILLFILVDIEVSNYIRLNKLEYNLVLFIESNCPSLVNCTKKCLLGMKESTEGCKICECNTEGIFQGDIMIDGESS